MAIHCQNVTDIITEVTERNITCFNFTGTEQVFNNSLCQLDGFSSVNISEFFSECQRNGSNSTAFTFVKVFRVKSFFHSFFVLVISLWLLVQICRCEVLHTTVNKLVGSLCVCGVLNATLGFLFVWPYDIRHYPNSCLMYICAYCATFIVTFVHFVIISLERYLYIVHPFTHTKLSKNNRPIGFVVIVVWVVSFIIAYAPFYATLKPNWKVGCLEMAFVMPFWLFLLIYGGVFLTATTIAGIVYFDIYRVASRHIRALERNKEHSLGARTTSVHSRSLDNNNPRTCGQTTAISDTTENYIHTDEKRHHQSSKNGHQNGRNNSVSFNGRDLNLAQDSTDNWAHSAISSSVFYTQESSALHPETGNGTITSAAQEEKNGNTPGQNTSADVTLSNQPSNSSKVTRRPTGTFPENTNDISRRSSARRATAKSKLRSAMPFVVLYFYYFMSWAPNTALKSYMAYINRPVQPKIYNEIVDAIALLTPIGYCLLFMYLEKDVRRVTLDKIFCFFRRRKIGSHPVVVTNQSSVTQ